MNGIYFDSFMQLFSGYLMDSDEVIDINIDKINVFCAGITDNDPDVNSKPTKDKLEVGTNRC